MLPDNVVSIGSYAFNGCSSIEKIDIPDNVVSIGAGAFEEAAKLSQLNIGVNSKLENIGMDFILFTSVKTIYVPKNVKRLVSFSIYDFGLTTVIIGEGTQLEAVENYATCGNVNTVYFGGSAEDWIDINIDSDCDDLLKATRYYYSETEPTDEGNYWYYDEKTNSPVIWE